ncbi:MAG TPA: dienelactone hydrolase family protein [Candidatus Sulfotelmatobacter sp.]|nr:dienelactone hydrolase family protein [Candidatus Sulfotelmatobacter sp.]
MCYEPTDRPPIAPMAGGSVETEHRELVASDGNRLAAYTARTGDRPSPHAILILPDVRGLHPFYEALAERFAEAGVDALAIDYFGRTAGAARRDDTFEFMTHTMQTTWAGLAADIEAGATALQADGPRPVYTVGFCFGGRASFLSATLTNPGFAGVIGFYGAPGPSRHTTPPPIDVAAQFTCPVLGLFGGADQGIPAEQVAAFDDALRAAGVRHELVTYPDAPHSFFDRKATDFAGESADAWRRILGFIGAPAAPAGAA